MNGGPARSVLSGDTVRNVPPGEMIGLTILPGAVQSADAPELEGRAGDHPVVVALVVDRDSRADAAGRAPERLGCRPEGSDFAAGGEHAVVTLRLNPGGAGNASGRVRRRFLDDYV